MASVEELAAAVRTALDKLPPAGLEQAATLTDEARQALLQVGSEQPQLQQAVGGLGETAENIGVLRQLVERTAGLLTGYLDKLGVSAPPSENSSTAGSSTPRADNRPAVAPAKPDGQKLSREHAEALQADMPLPVVSNTGVKTHGRWVDEHGQAHEITSGRDEDAAEAARLLQEHGIPPRGDLAATADVEQKLAARMVREGRKHLDVSLNNRPCRVHTAVTRWCRLSCPRATR
ncbi:nucleic acid/nucleotide deaminase of polymorphic system toxin [Amycolatopsis sulphurea]|uniref:Nucleic acid/nucleotide deaminase of polymorphic system toxin n=1 Tax=Amycolatopsis sulphurea TaxID=76022 RepID=A0A2A9FIS5_9PSEU|nr:nucleic acid/nucleotide deaminase of polymorphic system toxin [Amycolatopsis sulphurea]